MISDKEKMEILEYIPHLLQNLKGFRGSAREERAIILLAGKIRTLQSGMSEGVCPCCLCSGMEQPVKEASIGEITIQDSSLMGPLMKHSPAYRKRFKDTIRKAVDGD